MAGGYGGSPLESSELLMGDCANKKLPNLPEGIFNSSMVIHNDSILLIGGENNKQKCLFLDDDNTWKEHSVLNRERDCASAVATSKSTFVFGGYGNPNRYEYLPKHSTTWHVGKPKIPGKKFVNGCAIAVKSEQEIWLIGGEGTEDRIVSFNVHNHYFKKLSSKLNDGRRGHRCAFIPNTNKVIVTGGYDVDYCNFLSSTEILDTEDESVTVGSPMNSERYGHGIGVITINGEDRLAVFGGSDGNDFLDSVELYNAQTQMWECSDIKLNNCKRSFGFLS